MFLQLVIPSVTGSIPNLGASVLASVDSLFLYHPLQISAIVETVWRNRYNAANSPFVAWPQSMTDSLLTDTSFFSGYDFSTSTPIPQWKGALPSGGAFVPPNALPGIELPGAPPVPIPSPPPPAGYAVQPTIWDHLIYAYLIENTRIFDIFAKVLETYAYSEQLETPSLASQLFWRNTEYLMFGDGLPSMLWTTSSRVRRDEIANRLTVYNWMFGLDLSHAEELAAAHPYVKPAASNREFIATFESFAREVWKGILNAKNISGPNDSDAVAIATSARRLYDMMLTRRLSGNLAREEFRAVALMQWLHLAVLYDSPICVDLKATAASPEQRLMKIAERVGMRTHAKTKPLFDLAQAMSYLMTSIEAGNYIQSTGAALLYTLGTADEINAEVVIDQYSLATGRDIKSTSVMSTAGFTPPGGSRAAAPQPASTPRNAPSQRPAVHASNGRSTGAVNVLNR
jgi:hypothetical protein